jgi:hypothetical protein
MPTGRPRKATETFIIGAQALRVKLAGLLQSLVIAIIYEEF